MTKSKRVNIFCLNHNQNGNVAVIIIIAIVIFAGVFIINEMRKVPTGPVNEFPWTEEHRIVEDSSAIQLPLDDQFQLDELKTFSRSIQHEDQNRGRVHIEIDPSGLVEADWKATYTEGDYEKEFTAGLKGNVDSSMIYEDEKGIDEKKLFFIAKGKFILQAFKKNGNAMAGGGDAYIVGWIDPGGDASGTLVLAPEKKNTKVYKW